jgi:probable rRNA maturation factor
MIFIHIDDQLQLPETQSTIVGWLQKAAEETLLQTQVSHQAELSLVLSNDERLHELNREYLDIDAPTDVLSFPSDEIDPESSAPYLGDVIISCQSAAAQAQSAGHALKDELELLVVHGVLHLLGYDHFEPDEKQAMWSVQAEILQKLGANVSPP